MDSLTLLLALALSSPSADWPTWRGPTSNGLAPKEVSPPIEWSEDEGVRWRIELPGLGASTPIVLGDRLYLTSALPENGGLLEGEVLPPQRVPHRLLVLAYDRASGEEIWAAEVGEATPHEKLHKTSSLASASLVTDGERLYAFFGSHGLFALDLEGEVLWSKDLGKMTTLAEFGEGATPALAAGMLVVPWDHEGQSALIAFEASSGKERWRTPRELDSSWGSPVIVGEGEKARVFVTGSDKTHAYALSDGKPLWSCEGMSKNPVNSPTVAGDVLYVMNSYKGKVVQAVNPETAHVLWSYHKSASYVPNPVVVDGLLYFLRDSNGILNCLDAKTGEERYVGQRLDGIRKVHASPIAAAGRLYIASREGTVVVVKAGPEFEVLATNELDDCFDASPVMVEDDLFLRGRRFLYCIGSGE